MIRAITTYRATWKTAIVIMGLLALSTINAARAHAQQDGRVFALLVIDTDAKIAGLEDDERGMTAALASGFGSTRLLNLQVLTGGEVSPNAIVNAIRRFPHRTRRTLCSSTTQAMEQPWRGEATF